MKKRIAFFGIKSFPSRGGTDRVAENLIRQLKGRYNITLYCFKDPLAKNYIDGIKVVEFKPLLNGALGSFIYFFMSCMHILFSNSLHLIHAHKTDCAFFIPLLKLRFKVVATSHEAPYKRDKWNYLIKMYFHLVERMLVKSANQATCISNPLTEYYNNRYGRNVKFIPNGINILNKADYPDQLAHLFINGNATLEKPFILFSARRLMGTKGCHTMLEALQKINCTHQIFIAGEVNPNDPYYKLLKKLTVGLNVFFLGFVHPLPTLLALVDQSELFIFPSETEGMSIMLLEVASVGKPIIASDIPENKDVFSGEEVLYFKNKDADDLAEKIRYALENPLLMKEFGNNCQKKVFSNYLWSNIANSYASVYETMSVS